VGSPCPVVVAWLNETAAAKIRITEKIIVFIAG
jgi:hypothetical protein